MKSLIPLFCLCILLAITGIGNAQTCAVYCPDGSRPIVDCDSSADPCASSTGLLDGRHTAMERLLSPDVKGIRMVIA